MFTNDPNSPFYTETRRDTRERSSQKVFLAQGGLDLGEFGVRYGWKPSTYTGSVISGGALLGHPIRGIKSSYSYGLKGSQLFALPLGAYRAATAPRGKVVGNALGGIAGSILGASIGGLLAGPAGAIIGASTLSEPIEKITSGAINRFARIARENNNLQAGGNYKDTQIAYTLRQRAAQEMSGSLLNARQYLGYEGMLSHQ